jgi:hypothetical protein
MLDVLHELPARELGLESYKADFRRHFWTVGVSWKIERRQSFQEPGNPSWEAMAAGDWDTSLKLVEEMRAPRMRHQRELDARGIAQRRARVVSMPISPYLQWELHALRLWAELGEQIRVLSATVVRDLETTGELPEVVVLGDASAAQPVMYEILYREDRLAGARKFTDPELIAACRAEIAALWSKGEDLLDYFERVIAPLPPPAPQGV